MLIGLATGWCKGRVWPVEGGHAMGHGASGFSALFPSPPQRKLPFPRPKEIYVSCMLGLRRDDASAIRLALGWLQVVSVCVGAVEGF